MILSCSLGLHVNHLKDQMIFMPSRFLPNIWYHQLREEWRMTYLATPLRVHPENYSLVANIAYYPFLKNQVCRSDLHYIHCIHPNNILLIQVICIINCLSLCLFVAVIDLLLAASA
jgi:hypothetical protein